MKIRRESERSELHLASGEETGEPARMSFIREMLRTSGGGVENQREKKELETKQGPEIGGKIGLNDELHGTGAAHDREQRGRESSGEKGIYVGEVQEEGAAPYLHRFWGVLCRYLDQRMGRVKVG